ncbi:MAG: hypothetical protein Tsb005_13840 [Gammaproteobacteria bacterium]
MPYSDVENDDYMSGSESEIESSDDESNLEDKAESNPNNNIYFYDQKTIKTIISHYFSLKVQAIEEELQGIPKNERTSIVTALKKKQQTRSEKELKEEQQSFNDLIEKLAKGYCHGLSLARALLGKKAFFTLLETISAWDGEIKNFSNSIEFAIEKLMNAIEIAHHPRDYLIRRTDNLLNNEEEPVHQNDVDIIFEYIAPSLKIKIAYSPQDSEAIKKLTMLPDAEYRNHYFLYRDQNDWALIYKDSWNDNHTIKIDQIEQLSVLLTQIKNAHLTESFINQIKTAITLYHDSEYILPLRENAAGHLHWPMTKVELEALLPRYLLEGDSLLIYWNDFNLDPGAGGHTILMEREGNTISYYDPNHNKREINFSLDNQLSDLIEQFDADYCEMFNVPSGKYDITFAPLTRDTDTPKQYPELKEIFAEIDDEIKYSKSELQIILNNLHSNYQELIEAVNGDIDQYHPLLAHLLVAKVVADRHKQMASLIIKAIVKNRKLLNNDTKIDFENNQSPITQLIYLLTESNLAKYDELSLSTLTNFALNLEKTGLLEYLITQGLPVNTIIDDKPLLWHIIGKDIALLKQLLASGANPLYPQTVLDSPYMRAVELNDFDSLQALYDAIPPRENLPVSIQVRLFKKAVQKAQASDKILNFLWNKIEFSKDTDKAVGYLSIPITNNGNAEKDFAIFKEVINRGADINFYYGFTPLMLTFLRKKFDYTHYLLDIHENSSDKKLDLNKIDSKGQAVIHMAVQANQVDLVKRLQKLGANVNLQDKQGQTPLMLAVQNPKTDEVILNFLLEHSNIALTNQQGDTVLMLAVKQGNMQFLTQLFTRHYTDIDVKAVNESYKLAVENHQTDIAIFLNLLLRSYENPELTRVMLAQKLISTYTDSLEENIKSSLNQHSFFVNPSNSGNEQKALLNVMLNALKDLDPSADKATIIASMNNAIHEVAKVSTQWDSDTLKNLVIHLFSVVALLPEVPQPIEDNTLTSSLKG